MITSNLGKSELPKPVYTTVKVVPDDLDYELELIVQLSEEEFDQYSEKLRKHFLSLYEVKKFPIGTTGKSLHTIITDLRKFSDYDTNDILMPDIDGNFNVVSCFNKFSSAINHWFPEMYDTISGSSRFSIIDQLRDPARFKKNLHGLVIKDQFKFRSKDPLGKISNYIASGFRAINGAIPVANFPAGVAKWIYLNTLSKKQFRDKDTIRIYDSSMGWAGRMLGLLSACNSDLLKNKKVILFGTDPNTNTHERFQMILDFWKEYLHPEINFELHKSILGSEDIMQEPYAQENVGKFDIMLTSPPYFNREQYSNDETQSFKKFSKYDDWRLGFLQPTINNIYDLLTPGGYCYWNIADIKVSSSKDPNKSHLPLEGDSINFAKQAGFEHIETYKMLMASFVGSGRVDGSATLNKNLVNVKDGTRKFEPIFVFKK